MTSNKSRAAFQHRNMEIGGMNAVRSAARAIGAAVFLVCASVAQAVELPPGPNRELVARECQACHDAGMFVDARRDRESWNSVIDEMVSYGLRVDPDERAKILDYLATALRPQ
jgi:hypothetical protein